MSTRPRNLLLALSLSALLGSDAVARNIITGFSKAPTFTPPAGCVPRDHTYGVLSACEKSIEPGRKIIVSIDTAAGFFAVLFACADEPAAGIAFYLLRD